MRAHFGMAVAVTMLMAQPVLAESVIVNSDNFARAESDLYFSNTAAKYGFGKIGHEREMAKIDEQPIIRLNRDTIYSGGVFDLDAGPVTLTIPDPGDRFLSVQIIDEDHYTHEVHYGGGKIELTRDAIGTRYVFVGIRTLVNPEDSADMEAVRKLQDAMSSEQASVGLLETPSWDKASQDRVRDALLVLASYLPDTRGMFGAKDKVDPVRHLIGSAMGWGGNPETEALYLNRTEAKNDGKTVYKVNVKDVPVKGFWSISVYNAKGFYEANEYNSYTINNLTAVKSANGSVDIQFGGCDGKIVNCLPTPEGWNWMVRLYRPEAQILDGSWVFPQLEEVK